MIKAMSEHLPATAKERAHIVTRAAVIERIEARLAGSLDDTGLAAWAFDRFYAEELGVSRATVVAAIDELIAEGYAEGRHGSGVYVAPDLPDHVLRAAEQAAPLAESVLPRPAADDEDVHAARGRTTVWSRAGPTDTNETWTPV